MERTFNTAGPSVAGEHYMIDPLVRIDLAEIETLIERGRYFILHAPRQTGKTTALLALMHHLNAGGRYRALYCNIEGAQAARGDVAAGINTITSALADAAAFYLGDVRVRQWRGELLPQTSPQDLLRALLERWAVPDPRPAVLFLDEVDALVGDTLISLLRQIRAGYAQRPAAFPQTVILCGVRDVRDYRIHTSHHEIITGGSAFNIKAKSLRLGNFSRDETEALWRQHEDETGQAIDAAIFPELWEDTKGQPWLVNALGHEVTWEDRNLRERSRPITLEAYKAARERLTAFQQFFREHSEAWLDRFAYREAGPQLLMQAFLQRVVNGGGRINREYGLGRKRTDLFLEWPLDEAQGYHGPVQRVVIELKLVKKAPEATLREGLAQTADYADRVGADEAHLVLFDRRPDQSWDERIWQRAETLGGRSITVWGM